MTKKQPHKKQAPQLEQKHRVTSKNKLERGHIEDIKSAHKKSPSVAMGVGVLGLGNVGGALLEQLAPYHNQISVKQTLVRNLKRKRSGAAAIIHKTTDPTKIFTDTDIKVVVELMGGVDDAYAFIKQALQSGRSVVTANKAVIAKYGVQLDKLAQKNNVKLRYEAAVAGGIPIIRALRESLISDQIESITGILNGTTNFIIGEIERGAPYAKALQEAQRLGYAEADPTLDVAGKDAADKLSILSRLAFGAIIAPNKIPCAGIEQLSPAVLEDASRLGMRVKLLAQAHLVRGDIDCWVGPTMIPKTMPLAGVSGAQNGLSITSKALGTTFFQGPGAGGMATASAVLADLLEVTSDYSNTQDNGFQQRLTPPVSGPQRFGPQRFGPQRFGPQRSGHHTASGEIDPPTQSQHTNSNSSYYLRLQATEGVGVLEKITHVLADNNISIETVWQPRTPFSPHRANGNTPSATTVPIVITTHPTTAGAMAKAVSRLKRQKTLPNKAILLRVMT